MTPNEFKTLLDKYAAGQCSSEERILVDEWYANIDSEENRVIPLTSNLENQLWSKIKPSRSVEFNPAFFYRVAAALALVALAAIGIVNYSPTQEQLANHDAEKQIDRVDARSSVHFVNREQSSKRIDLSDGSSVVLQPGSSITYPKNFETEKRVVQLSGEGFFNVKRDVSRPFYVYSNEIVTKVLGTSFNIKAYDSGREIIVAVKTGKVSVSANPETEENRRVAVQDVILTPNQQVVYNRHAKIVSKQIVERPAVVVQPSNLFEMQFDGKPVTEIFDILQQNYGIEIRYDADILKDCVLTTKMSEEGFYERINIICKAINADYTTTDAVIEIKSAGCK
jgi:transmembrane sensor